MSLVRAKIEAPGTDTCGGLGPERAFGVVTLHRPVQRGRPRRVPGPVLPCSVAGLCGPAAGVPGAPAHAQRLEPPDQDGARLTAPITLVEPMPYIQFMNLVSGAAAVITDSGGVQEETTCLGIPCLTLRENTERPITVTEGSNRLVKREDLVSQAADAAAGNWPTGREAGSVGWAHR